MELKELVRALWSVKEDAHHAWKQALDGDESGLVSLGRSLKQLEKVIIERDTERA